MANAKRDKNFVPTKTAVLNTDGQTIVLLTANPSTHSLKISDGTTGSDLGPTNALRDQNDVPTILAVSSADDDTIVPLYSDTNGMLLIKST